MDGLTRITENILQEAELEARRIKEDAKKTADRIVLKAHRAAADLRKDAEKRAEEEFNSIIRRGRSAGEVAAKRVILTKKQEIISGIISEAYRLVQDYNTKSYFEYMEKLLDRYAKKQPGKLILNDRDKARVTETFTKAAKKHMLSISEATRAIDSGFILSYGDIEENCSLNAIIDEEKDRLYDMLNKLLFGQEELSEGLYI